MTYSNSTVHTRVCCGLLIYILISATAFAQTTNVDLPQFNEVQAKYGLMGRGQSVAVIDSGIAYNHEAFGGGIGPEFRVVAGHDFTSSNDVDPYDEPGPLGGHGTRVASVVAGAVQKADLVGLRVFNDNGTGYLAWVEQALRWVHENRNSFANPITTVNLSIGIAGNSSTSLPGSTIEDELAQLVADGIFVSASAGNDFVTYGVPGLAYPASSPQVVAAMCTNYDGRELSYFSQRLPRAIAAPGRMLTVAIPDYLGNNNGIHDDYRLSSGTDLSAPFLASASVLVREMMEFNGSTSITQQMIYDHLRSSADDIIDVATNQTYKSVNLIKALDTLAPADDFGSTLETAELLGTINGASSRSGTLGTLQDIDFFKFTAGQTGNLRLQTGATHYLVPSWTIYNANGTPITTTTSTDFSFPVQSGLSYSLGLSTSQGIGHFSLNLTLDSEASILPGDYNGNGTVDAADYSVWRASIGSTSDFRADGNNDGVVDSADYEFWKQRFGMTRNSGMAAANAPEPRSTTTMFVAALFATAAVRFRGFTRCGKSWRALGHRTIEADR